MSRSSSRRDKPVIRDRRPLLQVLVYAWVAIFCLVVVFNILSAEVPSIEDWLESVPIAVGISIGVIFVLFHVVVIFASRGLEGEERFQRRREKILGPPEKMPDPDDPFRIPR